jgi:hypothetical protein
VRRSSSWIGCRGVTGFVVAPSRGGRVKSPRFLFVVGVGTGPEAHPIWPDVHQPFAGEPDDEGSWVAWRLTGANHRELGRSARVFADLTTARLDATALHERIAEAQAHILTVPHTGTWGWRLRLDDVPVATSSRGYSRHRECTYNVSAFVAAASIAALSEGEPPRTWQLVEPRAVGPALSLREGS